MAATAIPQKFYSLRAFAELFGTSPSVVLGWLRAGLPHYQPAGLRGRYYISLEEALAWLKNQTAESRNQGPQLKGGAPSLTPSRTQVPRRRGRPRKNAVGEKGGAK